MFDSLLCVLNHCEAFISQSESDISCYGVCLPLIEPLELYLSCIWDEYEIRQAAVNMQHRPLFVYWSFVCILSRREAFGAQFELDTTCRSVCLSLSEPLELYRVAFAMLLCTTDCYIYDTVMCVRPELSLLNFNSARMGFLICQASQVHVSWIWGNGVCIKPESGMWKLIRALFELIMYVLSLRWIFYVFFKALIAVVV